MWAPAVVAGVGASRLDTAETRAESRAVCAVRCTAPHARSRIYGAQLIKGTADRTADTGARAATARRDDVRGTHRAALATRRRPLTLTFWSPKKSADGLLLLSELFEFLNASETGISWSKS